MKRHGERKVEEEDCLENCYRETGGGSRERRESKEKVVEEEKQTREE